MIEIILALVLSFTTPCPTEDSHMCTADDGTTYLFHVHDLTENDNVPTFRNYKTG